MTPIPDAVAGPVEPKETFEHDKRDIEVFEVCNGYIKAIMEGDQDMIQVYQDLYDQLDEEGTKCK